MLFFKGYMEILYKNVDLNYLNNHKQNLTFFLNVHVSQ